ncbi:MAG: S-adenosyl-methyltransferase [Flavobacteriales bacterium MED-G15]|nr:MAG: S-adenosyl-methyltransferase [Flavobacteriales bacterium MED-G15]|tara:strand:- start:2209 stop:2520 length:312 start_codon:yes stop_codon:yes gene_type:complete
MKSLISLLKMEFLVNDESFRNWRMIIYLSLLALIMIASGHGTDRKIFRIAQLNDDLKMLKSEFIEQRTNLMNLKMETKITRELESIGVGPAKSPPIKIIVTQN